VNAFVRPESMEVPEGGLASFLTATVGEWADDDETFVPQSGIGNVKSVADKLAEYGRYEDTYMVHAAEGETVVPMAVFDENPRLKETLFKQMRAMGIDPEQYVVGSELNSLNPVTGQPEFFLKKLFKGLKKAVKSVVKVVKKIAPLVLSVGLSMTPLGLIAGSALGSGIGTLVQGGSLKDALKMGAIGGLTAGLFKGVTGAIGSKLQGGTLGAGFKSGIQSGLPDAIKASQAQALAQGSAQAANAALPPPSAPAGSTTVAPAPNLPAAVQEVSRAAPSNIPANMQMTVTAPRPAALAPVQVGADVSRATIDQATQEAVNRELQENAFNEAVLKGPAAPAAPANVGTQLGNQSAMSNIKPPGFFDSVKDIFAPSGDSPLVAAKKAFFPSTVSPQDVVAERLGLDSGASVSDMVAKAGSEEAFDTLIESATKALSGAEGYNPNMLRQYGPLAGAGLGILGLTGGFKPPEMDAPVDPFNLGGQGAFDLLAANPDQYRIFSQGGPYAKRPYGAAKGGSITNFPPKIGAISGPGTGTSDDIPAMLSDGEFVMTARAVNGAGNGNRQRGMKKMYEVMRTFEGVA